MTISYRALYQDNEVKVYQSVDELIADFNSQREWSICDVMIIDTSGSYYSAFRLTKQVLATHMTNGTFEKETQILFSGFGQ